MPPGPRARLAGSALRLRAARGVGALPSVRASCCGSAAVLAVPWFAVERQLCCRGASPLRRKAVWRCAPHTALCARDLRTCFTVQGGPLVPPNHRVTGLSSSRGACALLPCEMGITSPCSH